MKFFPLGFVRNLCVLCLLAGTAPALLRSQTPTPSFIVTSTAGTATGTCTNQSAQGATLDGNCTVYAAFQAVTALNNTSTSSYTPTITFAPALYGKTITMTVGSTVKGNVALVGPGPGANAITLNGNNVLVNSSSEANVTFLQQLGVSNTTLSGLTFKGFETETFLGAVLNANTGTDCYIELNSGPVTLTSDVFLDNYAPALNGLTCGLGGAVYINGSVTISGSTFQGNIAGNAGGAVYAGGGGSISNSTFTQNRILPIDPGYQGGSSNFEAGGAVYASGGLTVTNSNFTGNYVVLSASSGSILNQGGGAIFQPGGGSISGCNFVQNAVIDGNNAAGDIVVGGAVYAEGPVTNSTFIGNLIETNSYANTQAYGGAVYTSAGVTGTLFSNNQIELSSPNQQAYGGAVALDNTGSITFSNDTFTRNSIFPSGGGGGAGQGGALYAEGYQIALNLVSDTIVNNSVTVTPTASAGGVYFAPGSGTVTAVNTVISGNSALTSYADEYGVTNGGNNYMDTSATASCTTYCAPLLSALGTYGGTAVGATGATSVPQTMLPLPGSPLLASGNPTYSGLPTTDERGFPRTTTYNGGSHVDIGATEATYTLGFVQQPTRTLVNTNISPTPTVQLLESGVVGGVVQSRSSRTLAQRRTPPLAAPGQHPRR